MFASVLASLLSILKVLALLVAVAIGFLGWRHLLSPSFSPLWALPGPRVKPDLNGLILGNMSRMICECAVGWEEIG